MRIQNHSATCVRGTDDRRRGTIMVVFALIVFALMGLAAIAIDIGLASLTQAQMQTAVDTAALEGVQHRDFHDYRHKSNTYRRPRASELVQQVFDDDLHPTSGIAYTGERPGLPQDDADEGHFGAGPILTLTPTPGMPVPGASQTMSVPGVPVLDDPVLQANCLDPVYDLACGDMLSGAYRPEADPQHLEASDYTRADFVRATDKIESRQALGFLVRMRRTNGQSPLDALAGISSRGPTVPLLFGIGAVIVPEEGSSVDPRLEGLTVRATAIAAARPALAVGPVPLDTANHEIVNRAYPPSELNPVRGLAPVALTKRFWTLVVSVDEHEPSEPELVDLDGDFSLLHEGFIVGRCDPICTSVGRRVLPAGPPQPTMRYAYFAIYDDIADGSGAFVERVIGYGYGYVSYAQGATKLKVSKGIEVLDEAPIPPEIWPCAVIVAADNASAHLAPSSLPSFEQDPDLDADTWERVFAAHVAFVRRDGAPGPQNVIPNAWQDIRPGTLLAPALVR